MIASTPASDQAVQHAQNTKRCSLYEEIEPSTGVTFVVVAMFGGLISYHILSFVPLPYTALLMVRHFFCKCHLSHIGTHYACIEAAVNW